MQSANLLALMLRLWNHLLPRRRKQCMLLMGLVLASAFAEIISLGAVLPFLGALTMPDRILRHPIVAKVAKVWGISTGVDLLLPLTVAFVVAALIAGGLRLLLLWVNTRFSFAVGADLSIKVYERTLYQPYWVHVARNSSEIISGITGKVGGIVYGGVLPALTLISSAVLMTAIIFALLTIDAMVTTVASACFAVSYLLITWLFRHRLEKNSQRIAAEQTQVLKALQEGLGGIRDVLLDGTQPVYCSIYGRADNSLRIAQGNNMFMATAPRYAIEAVVMVLIAALAYGLSRKATGVASILPVLGALALGAQRLLPALQQAYGSWAGIVGSKASLADALDLLDQPLPPEANQPAPAPLSFQKDLRFEAVSFRYGTDGPWVLDGLDLTIPKGARVGFVGSTGSGKSTSLDLLMGLLEPNKGRILVDGQPINSTRRRAWQQTIAHVPQSIYLADTTISENIAFGVPTQCIDFVRVQWAARQAMIDEFIESRPEGYRTFVGERGVRLSGGQRQRIGIARALYKKASVLVFDEATSSLDNITEHAVIESIENLDAELTILLIAHRVTTVQHCDIIIEMECGRVVDQGPYNLLLERSPSFRKMVQIVG